MNGLIKNGKAVIKKDEIKREAVKRKFDISILDRVLEIMELRGDIRIIREWVYLR